MQQVVWAPILAHPLPQSGTCPMDVQLVIDRLAAGRRRLCGLSHPPSVPPGILADGFWSLAWVLRCLRSRLTAHLLCLHVAVKAAEALLAGAPLDPDAIARAQENAREWLREFVGIDPVLSRTASASLRLLETCDACRIRGSTAAADATDRDLVGRLSRCLELGLSFALDALCLLLHKAHAREKTDLLLRYLHERLTWREQSGREARAESARVRPGDRAHRQRVGAALTAARRQLFAGATVLLVLVSLLVML